MAAVVTTAEDRAVVLNLCWSTCHSRYSVRGINNWKLMVLYWNIREYSAPHSVYRLGEFLSRCPLGAWQECPFLTNGLLDSPVKQGLIMLGSNCDILFQKIYIKNFVDVSEE